MTNCFKSLFIIYSVAFLVALPSLLWLKSNLDGSFLHIIHGWTTSGTNPFIFWWNNTGLLIPVSILGIWKFYCSREPKANRELDYLNTSHPAKPACADWRDSKNIFFFFLPFFILFAITNFVSFQPWDWDNIKILTWIFLFLSIPVGHLLSICLRFPKSNEQDSGNLNCHSGGPPADGPTCLRRQVESQADPSPALLIKSMIGGIRITKHFFLRYPIRLIGLICLISLIFSGLLSLINQSQHTFTIYDNQDIDFANWVKLNTNPQDIFLVDPQPTHPLQGLTGRSAFMGYAGHLWVHGINYGKRESIVNRVLSGDLQALTEADVKINYLVIEKSKQNLFSNHPSFKQIFQNQKFVIYQII